MARKITTKTESEFTPVLDKDVEQLFKKHRGTIQRLGLAGDNTKTVDVLSTGSLQLDYRINYGGIPQGRITHIYGPTRSLKSTIAMNTILSAFNKYDNPLCMVLDFERTMDDKGVLDWYKFLGFSEEQAKSVIIARDMPEKCFDLAQDFVQHPRAAVLIVDSVGAMEPSKEFEKSFDDNAKVAARAFLVKKFLNKINTVNNNCAVIMINQVMDNFGAGLYGPAYTYGGGNALKHMPSLTLDVKGYHVKDNKTDKTAKNSKVNLTVRVEKCKIGGENQQIPIIFDFNTGRFDKLHDCITLANELGLITQAGAWFYLKETPESEEILLKMSGGEAFTKAISENPEYVKIIENYVISQIVKNREINLQAEEAYVDIEADTEE